jgi:hypothetical protein
LVCSSAGYTIGTRDGLAVTVIVDAVAMDIADMLIARSCAVRSRRGSPSRGSVRAVSDERREAAVPLPCPFPLNVDGGAGGGGTGSASWSSEVGTDERIECGGVSRALEKRCPGIARGYGGWLYCGGA